MKLTALITLICLSTMSFGQRSDTVYQNGTRKDKVSVNFHVKKVGDTLLTVDFFANGGGNVSEMNIWLEFDIGVNADIQKIFTSNFDTAKLDAVIGSRESEILKDKKFNGSDYGLLVKITRTYGEELKKQRWNGGRLFTMSFRCKKLISDPSIRINKAEATGPTLMQCEGFYRYIPVIGVSQVFAAYK